MIFSKALMKPAFGALFLCCLSPAMIGELGLIGISMRPYTTGTGANYRPSQDFGSSLPSCTILLTGRQVDLQ
jgi:hypothetical protein